MVNSVFSFPRFRLVEVRILFFSCLPQTLFMLKFSKESIKEIGGQLDSGMVCFYHLRTGELVCFPDELHMAGELEEEVWGEDIAKVNANPGDFLAFPVMKSIESFRLMEAFISTIAEEKIRCRFADVIHRKKPFYHFKNLLTDFPDLRQQWFAYKDQCYQEYIQDQVDDYNASLMKKKEQ